MPVRKLRGRVAVLSAVTLGSVGVLCAVLLPTSAMPGDLLSAAPTHGMGPEARVHAVGDGSLPETPPRLRAPHEPLSSSERGYAFHLAREAMSRDTRDVLGESGGELLAADLPPLSERTADRRVVVSLYDYAADELHELLLDLTHRTMLSSRSTHDLQLPPTQAETAAALELAVGTKPSPVFVDQYRTMNNTPLLTVDQVTAVGGAWRPTDERPTGRATQACGQHRCLQLLIALPTGEYLDTHDIVVDLSTRKVLRTELEDHSHAH